MIAQRPMRGGLPGFDAVHFQIGEIALSLRGDDAEILEDFTALYRRHRRDAGAPSSIEMEVRRCRRGLRRRFVVMGDGVEFRGGLRSNEVLPHLEWGINHRVVARCSQFLQFHAASLIRDGSGVILVAPSGSGKSTLAAGLIKRGWTYLSDEFALVDPSHLRLHAFPKALCIKSGSFLLMEQMGIPLWRQRYYVKAFKGTVGYVCPGEYQPSTLPAPSSIGFVIFPSYVPNGPPRIFPITRARAAFALCGGVMNRQAFGPAASTVAARVAEQARCFALETNELATTCDLIESMLKM